VPRAIELGFVPRIVELSERVKDRRQVASGKWPVDIGRVFSLATCPLATRHLPAPDLELLVRSRYALIILDTVEAEQGEQLARQIAARLSLHYFLWTRSKGLRRRGTGADPIIDGTADPVQALASIEREGAGIYLFRELGSYLHDPHVASHVHDVVAFFGIRRGALLVTGHNVTLPDALRP
jgi:hypothetical protein